MNRNRAFLSYYCNTQYGGIAAGTEFKKTERVGDKGLSDGTRRAIVAFWFGTCIVCPTQALSQLSQPTSLFILHLTNPASLPLLSIRLLLSPAISPPCRRDSRASRLYLLRASSSPTSVFASSVAQFLPCRHATWSFALLLASFGVLSGSLVHFCHSQRISFIAHFGIVSGGA
jgi:hypothetical protein